MNEPRGPEGGKREDGAEGGAAAGRHHKELPPVVVTKENAKEVFADDPDRLALLTD